MMRKLGMMTLAMTLGLVSARCGGGSNPTAPPVTQPTPAPVPTPTPVPAPTAPPGCQPGGDCPGNQTPVARTILRLYALLDPGGGLVYPTPGHDHGVITTPIQLNYTCRMDVTGRDKDGIETNGVDGTGNGIVWYYSDPSMIEENIPGNWQRKLRVIKTGAFKVFVVFDGIGSNDLNFTFIP